MQAEMSGRVVIFAIGCASSRLPARGKLPRAEVLGGEASSERLRFRDTEGRSGTGAIVLVDFANDLNRDVGDERGDDTEDGEPWRGERDRATGNDAKAEDRFVDFCRLHLSAPLGFAPAL